MILCVVPSCTIDDDDGIASPDIPTTTCGKLVEFVDVPLDQLQGRPVSFSEVIAVNGFCLEVLVGYSGCGVQDDAVSLYTDGISSRSIPSRTNVTLTHSKSFVNQPCQAYYEEVYTFDLSPYVSLPTKLTIATAEGDTTLLIE